LEVAPIRSEEGDELHGRECSDPEGDEALDDERVEGRLLLTLSAAAAVAAGDDSSVDLGSRRRLLEVFCA
jgi:hypothetical protein